MSLPRLFLWIVVAASVAACDPSSFGPPGEGSGGPDAPDFTTVPVQVESATRRDLRRTVAASTTLESAREVSVVSELSGTLVELTVERGDEVSEGQLIARVVNDDVRISIAEARDAVEQNEHEVERLRPLFEQGYLARQTFEQAEFQLRTAETNLRRLQSQGASQTIRAPMAGVITSRSATQGEVVVPNQALVVITALDALEARINVPERELGALRVGQAAEIAVEAYADVAYAGRVARIDPIVDPQTGTVQVRIALTQSANQPRLRPGMFAAVRVVTDVHADAVAIPKRAVVREAGTAHFFIIGDEIDIEAPEGSGDAPEGPVYAVRRIEAEFGYEDRDWIEVLDGSVDADARVVVVGQSGLDASDRVTIPADDTDG